MEQFLQTLKRSPLFFDAKEEEITAMLTCLSAQVKQYEKHDFLLHVGDRVEALGLVLTGCLHIGKEDLWGNRNIVTEVTQGEIFAEAYACTGAPLRVNVIAAERSQVLFLNIRRVLTVCSSNCAYHTRLIGNLMSVLAGKNLLMNEKLFHMAQRSIRDKLMSYLSTEAQRQGKRSFDIPFNRQQLADYLSVDRSALSNELSKLQKDGVLQFHKNHFVLLQQKQGE